MLIKVLYTKPLRKLLKEGGIWMNFSGHKHEVLLKTCQILRYIFLLSVYALLLSKLFREGVRFLLTPSAVFVPLGGVLLALTSMMLFKSSKLEYLTDQCELNFSVYRNNWEVEIIKSQCEKFSMFINIGKYLFRSFTSLYIFLPLIIDGMRAVLGYRTPYSLPTPLEGYMEANGTRNLHFYLIIIISDIWLWIAMSTCIGIECVIFFMVSYITTEIKILKIHLNMLYPKSDPESFTNEVDLLAPWNLRQIIIYHRQIMRLNKLNNECISFPYVMQNISVTLSLCFLMFLIRQLINQNMVMLFLTVTFIMMLVVMLIVVCYAGEFLQAQSEDLFQTLYKIPWYRQNPKVRKALLLMMTQAAKPLVLDYKQSYINILAFKEIMNTSYSYFMLMNSLSTD